MALRSLLAAFVFMAIACAPARSGLDNFGSSTLSDSGSSNNGGDSGSQNDSGSGACGATGEPCCNGTACNATLVCISGSCTTSCGAAGQSCCHGTACNGGLLCQNSRCEAVDSGSVVIDGGPSLTDGGGCVSDSNCANGMRCCTTDGTCNPTVAEGSDCGCDTPCPADDACMTGVCGAAPARCYPGCFPGSTSGAGELPASCLDQNGMQAFCTPVPMDQITTANQGGACIVGDNCDVIAQNCGMMPLDRSQPEGANNPPVPYNCLPLTPTLNGCFPAGELGAGASGCTLDCGAAGGNTSAILDNCAAGYACVQLVNSAGTIVGSPTCEKQCSSPSTTGTVDSACPGGDETCVGDFEPFGQQKLNFDTGSCCIPPGGACSSASAISCCSATCGTTTAGECE